MSKTRKILATLTMVAVATAVNLTAVSSAEVFTLEKKGLALVTDKGNGAKNVDKKDGTVIKTQTNNPRTISPIYMSINDTGVSW